MWISKVVLVGLVTGILAEASLWKFDIDKRIRRTNGLRKYVREQDYRQVKQFSGTFEITRGYEIFFWMFFAKEDAESKPLIVRFNSESNESCIYGADYRLWPFTLSDGSGMGRNYSPRWDSLANVVYIDTTLINPPAETINDSAAVLYLVLQRLKKEVSFIDDIHIMGENYDAPVAAKLAQMIIVGNKRMPHYHLNIKSVILGGGFLDTLSQVLSYPEFACNNNIIKLGDSECKKMHQLKKTCKDAALLKSELEIETCINNLFPIYQKKSENIYNIRQSMQDLINSEEHARGSEYYMQIPEVQLRLNLIDNINASYNISYLRPITHLNYISALDSLSVILDAQVSLLIYTGDADFITNSLGQLQLAKNIPWPGQSYFQTVEPSTWESQITSLAVSYQRYENLWVATIPESGHFVLKDQPQLVRSFLDYWWHQAN